MPTLDAVEIPGLLQSIVMFVGRDARTGQLRILGSGFVVAVGSSALVISAAHVFVDWTNAVRPAKQHSLTGVAGDADDFIQRMKPLLVSGAIKAVLNLDDPVGGRLCGIEWISSDADPTRLDVALVSVRLPPNASPQHLTVLPLDFAAFAQSTPVVMAGYADGDVLPDDIEKPFGKGRFIQGLACRAGYIVEQAEKPDGYKSGPMYRAAIPSLPGMSGGPVILDRNFEAQSAALIHARPVLPLTAVGVVSRSRIGSPLLMDSCPEGDTWLSPISNARQLILPTDKGAMTLGDAIDSGVVPSFKP